MTAYPIPCMHYIILLCLVVPHRYTRIWCMTLLCVGWRGHSAYYEGAQDNAPHRPDDRDLHPDQVPLSRKPPTSYLFYLKNPLYHICHHHSTCWFYYQWCAAWCDVDHPQPLPIINGVPLDAISTILNHCADSSLMHRRIVDPRGQAPHWKSDLQGVSGPRRKQLTDIQLFGMRSARSLLVMVEHNRVHYRRMCVN